MPKGGTTDCWLIVWKINQSTAKGHHTHNSSATKSSRFPFWIIISRYVQRICFSPSTAMRGMQNAHAQSGEHTVFLSVHKATAGAWTYPSMHWEKGEEKTLDSLPGHHRANGLTYANHTYGQIIQSLQSTWAACLWMAGKTRRKPNEKIATFKHEEQWQRFKLTTFLL